MKIKDISLEFLGHSGFVIEYQNKRIAIDPYNTSENLEKVDVILISHSHHDHCSIKDIEKLSKKGTLIIIPADAQSKINKINDVEMQIVSPDEEIMLFEKIKVKTIHAYNIKKNSIQNLKVGSVL